MGDIVVIGHRGAAGYYPENTLLSFRKAFEMGVDYVELDVRLSSDSIPVVIHDETLDRTTNGRGYVKDYTVEELKRLDAGLGERIPTLEEALRLAIEMNGKLLIEIKDVEAVDEVVSLVREYDFIRSCKIISFYIEALKRVPSYIERGLIYAWPGKWIIEAIKLRATTILPKYNLVSERMVKYAHLRGLKVYTWNIDDRDTALRIISTGVDGIASNKPDIILKLLNRME